MRNENYYTVILLIFSDRSPLSGGAGYACKVKAKPHEDTLVYPDEGFVF